MINENFGVSTFSSAAHLVRSANANTAPTPPTGAVTSDLGLSLLYKIAGVRP